MRPGGHLATAVALSGIGYTASGSVELAAGCLVGGFLIDGDHYLDYLIFERQWPRPGPSEFLRYYFTHRFRRVVLPLHSIELVGALTLLAVVWPRAALVGYVSGALLHLILDIVVNGAQIRGQPILYYCFVYRASLGFSAARLLAELILPPESGREPVREFFTWRPPERRLGPIPGHLDPLSRGSSKPVSE